MKKNLFFSQTKQIQSPPSTPRKKSQFKQHSFNSQPKIKYRYTVIQKPSSTWLGNLFIIIWLLIFVGAFAISYSSKITLLEISVKQEIEKCHKDYVVNKCQTPLKGIKQFCEEKLKCLEADPNQVLKTKMQGMLFVGSIIREFFEGLGFPLICIGLIYLIFANRKSHETKKQFVEYYE